jgi:NAD+ kinase
MAPLPRQKGKIASQCNVYATIGFRIRNFLSHWGGFPQRSLWRGLSLRAPTAKIGYNRKAQGKGGKIVTDRICFLASNAEAAQTALLALTKRYGQCSAEAARFIVALGGDGFMLQTLHKMQSLDIPVYGMNCGTLGFLMNAYAEDGLPERLAEAEEEILHPLAMRAVKTDGTVAEGLAINEVSLLRAGPQAAKLRISIDGRVRMDELVCDGALLSTPAGSTAYNYSAHGPILPIGSDVLALTAIAAFRPRRWRGALLPRNAKVRFDVLEPEKRPVRADADSISVPDVLSVEIETALSIGHRLLFDEGHGLEERLLREQFV